MSDPAALDLELETFLTEELGDSTYLLASGGEALLVDPQRDVWRFIEAARRRGWRIRRVLETHAHNDYLSGALEVRAATGAEIVAPGRGGYGFPHRPVDQGDVVELGDLRLVARATPGHTFEHVAWQVHEGDAAEPTAVFTGGSLLVGSAGRTDLVGPEATEALTRSQYRTLQALADLPDDVVVLPTHGSGSFCASNLPDLGRRTTIGLERERNAALHAPDETTFLERQLAALGRYPAYYAHMGSLNRAGPPVVGHPPEVEDLGPEAVDRRVAEGAAVVDARDREAFASRHLPGSLNVELGDSFSAYVGWLVPFGRPVVLVLPEDAPEAAREAAVQLFRIGYGTGLGRLAGGVDAWEASGRRVRTYPTVRMRELHAAWARGERPRIIDVRQPAEWAEEGILPGSEQVFVGDLPARVGSLAPSPEAWVVCVSGYRAAIGASLLDAAGIPVRLVAAGGVVGWVDRFRPVASGPTSDPIPGDRSI
ncbi:MAG TPA: rhodanese-like domain-containing protein [Candidatus Limnocylindrales bacterium]|nr:rhodanese-like domain-containing protein [Candidatus Limnocylindrales bacterium]